MIREMFAGVARHWFVSLVGVLASIGLAAAVVLSAPATYVAERDLLLVPSPTSVDPEFEVNPLFYLGGLLDSARSVAVAIASQDSVQSEYAPEGSGLGFVVESSTTVGAPSSTTVGAPVINIQAEAPSPEQADQLADDVVGVVGEQLDELQLESGAPESTWINTTLIGSSQEPERNWQGTLRLTLVALVMGLSITVGVVAVLVRRDESRASQVPLV